MIYVQPVREAMPQFAQWAVAQQPKVRTSSSVAFAVPDHLFVEVPEDLLIGALVDGHRYVSPDEDAQTGESASGEPRLLACGLCYEEAGEEVHPHPACPLGTDPALVEAAMSAAVLATGLAALRAPHEPDPENTPGDPLPEVPESVDGPDDVPLGPVPDEGDEAVTLATDEANAAAYPCPLCARPFTSERGRDMHRRQVHQEA